MTHIDENGQRKTGFAFYNLMLALWVGGIFIYTFLITPIIFKSFERDTASAIVDKLFPFYFPYSFVIIILTFGFFFISGSKRKARHKLVIALLISAVLISMFINFGLYPEIKKTKREIASFEKTPVDSPARKRFKTLHGISMTLNLVLLADGAALIVIGSIRKKGN
jgi:uncharacterized membrane protein